jgi:cob(I)alamin adenosyltransferase
MPSEVNGGLVQIYTGDGKGKTTAAIGLAIRACGQGQRVGFIQFLKNEPCGEHFFLSSYPAFQIIQISTENCFTGNREKIRAQVQKTLVRAEEMLLSGHYDLLVLDEICVAIHLGVISIAQVLHLIEIKPGELELVLTGRYAPPELIKQADLVTEMIPVKHPLSRGIKARRGIEY